MIERRWNGWRPWVVRLVLLSCLACASGTPGARAQERSITLGSTTSTENSGLFGAILPVFTEKTGIEVRVIAVGTGQALKLGERGDVDLLLVHDKSAEEAFVAAGFGIERRDVMFNDFVLVGPAADPAAVKGARSAITALKLIAATHAPFISRGDDSGTHRLELRLWKEAGVEVKAASGTWYRESGSGMGATLNMAAASDAYALTDRATWLAFKNKATLAIRSEGDERLYNQYGVILVNPARFGHLRASDARAFRDWLISSDGQAVIGAFRIAGQPAFFPNAEARGAASFGVPLAGVKGETKNQFEFGQALFNTHAQLPRAPQAALAGLGPTYNMEGCGGCHIADGRGHPPLILGEPVRQMVIRLSVKALDGGVVPHPAYGAQLNDRAVDDVPIEGQAFLEYSAVNGSYGDGTPFDLVRPHYAFLDMVYGPLEETTLISARAPPHVAGIGLLEAIPDAAIVARADEDDVDGDGISGRPSRALDRATGSLALGRLGWKANQPSLAQQVADAALHDMGLTTRLFPREDCPPVQTACAAAISAEPELDDERLAALTTYIRLLDAPARRDAAKPEVVTGERSFAQFGCASCHAPLMPIDQAAIPASTASLIAPYSDLLLHDMGEGLDDGRADQYASGREWRTAPLWGIGLTEPINGHTRFLHDGRARNLAEAILWHGGEAEAAKEKFRTAPAAERQALLDFLNSL